LPADLTFLERAGIVFGLVAVLVFGGLVEMRSAFLKRHMTDLQVYLRAAWAVRAGEDLYSIKDDNGWHYHYSPLFALLMTPLADPPPCYSRDGMLPFGLSVGLWYAISIACLMVASHCLAKAIEETVYRTQGRRVEPYSRAWWGLRLIPVLACLPPICQTLMRGQVNLILLAVLCAMSAAFLRGRSVRAGLWLSLAICLKIIPAFLLLYPLWRRDMKCLGGCLAGLIVGLILLPGVVLGPTRTIAYYEEWLDVLVRPAFGVGVDRSRAKELIEVTATDSQAPVAVIHNVLNPDRTTRPNRPSDAVRLGHRLVGLFLIGVTLWTAGFRQFSNPLVELTVLGALIVVMLFISPVCHLHYFCLTLPIALALVANSQLKNDGKAGRVLEALFIVTFTLALLPSIPGLEPLRDFGMSGLSGLILWASALVVARRLRDEKGNSVERSVPLQSQIAA
jgi:hypothetical protein